MAETFEFELVFALPAGDHDAYELSDAVFAAGFDDAIIGTGIVGLLAVELEASGGTAENAILDSARAILKGLPAGARLREVRPDLVSLADVAAKLGINRQALQKRDDLPAPTSGGLYRIDEIGHVLLQADTPRDGKRKPRFDIGLAKGWLLAGAAARQINARLTLGALDPVFLAEVGKPERVLLAG